MRAFDPLEAIEWLDAYRERELARLLELYDDQAVAECGCGGPTILVGKIALSHYWAQRFIEKPALELEDIALEGEDVRVVYRTPVNVVTALLGFGAGGKITRTRCRPFGPTLQKRTV